MFATKPIPQRGSPPQVDLAREADLKSHLTYLSLSCTVVE